MKFHLQNDSCANPISFFVVDGIELVPHPAAAKQSGLSRADADDRLDQEFFRTTNELGTL